MTAVAAAAGISLPFLLEIERGYKLPSLNMLAWVAEVVDTSLVALLSGLPRYGRKSLEEGSFGVHHAVKVGSPLYFANRSSKGLSTLTAGVLLWFADQFTQCSLLWRLCWVVSLSRHRRVR